jgi:hypothetical protein
MRAELETEAGAPIAWIEERGPGLERGTAWRLEGAGGEMRAPPRHAGRLFARDLQQFAEVLEGRREIGAERQRVLHCLALAEEIEKRAHS